MAFVGVVDDDRDVGHEGGGHRGGGEHATRSCPIPSVPMPELPEVERARALIADRALGRRIARVDDTDAYVTRPHVAGEIAAALTGRTLTAANRRGKAMWIETDDGEGP